MDRLPNALVKLTDLVFFTVEGVLVGDAALAFRELFDAAFALAFEEALGDAFVDDFDAAVLDEPFRDFLGVFGPSMGGTLVAILLPWVLLPCDTPLKQMGRPESSSRPFPLKTPRLLKGISQALLSLLEHSFFAQS